MKLALSVMMWAVMALTSMAASNDLLQITGSAVITGNIVLSVSIGSASTNWSRNAGGTGTDQGRGVGMDTNGNVFVTGYFTGPATFGSTNLAGLGGQDIFVSKYSPTGTLLWVQSFWGTNGDYPESLAVDRYGDVLVTGTFQSIITFGATTYTNVSSTTDMFVLKLSGSDGSVLWSKQIASNADEHGHGVTTDPSNADVVVVGEFAHSVVIGSITLSAHSGSQDSLVARYTSAGAVLWATNFNCGANDSASSAAVDNQGAVYITGAFLGSIDCGGGAQNATVGTSTTDIYVVKLTGSNVFVWSKVYGGLGGDSGTGIAVDSNRDVFLTGIFGNADIDLGGGAISHQSTDENAFLAKYLSSNGSHIWSKGFAHSANAQQFSSAVIVNANDNVSITGSFKQSSNFGTGVITSAGDWDVFVAQFVGSTGFASWSKRLGGTGADLGYGISVLVGEMAVAGATFGGNFDGGTLTIFGGYDAFVDKFTPP